MRSLIARSLAAALGFSAAGSAFAPVLVGAATPAGTVISNAATATYSDGTNTYTTQSNTVTITVQDVATATIVVNSTAKTLAPNQLVDDTYTVTNTGNGKGTFAFNPTVTSTSGTSPVISTVTFTPYVAGVAQTPITCTPAQISGSTCAALSIVVNPGDYVKVDILYNDGTYVQSTGSTSTVTSNLAAPMTYASANNGGNAPTTVTPTPASLTNTIQADAIVDVQKSSPALTSASQNIVFTLLANNRGYFSTQPLGLASLGSGLPATGVVIADPIQASLGAGNRFAALPSIVLSNGATGTAAFYYTTTPIATIRSNPASTTWTQVPATLGALNAITGITDIVAVISGGGSGLAGTGSGGTGASNGPPATGTPSVTTPQVTITLTFTQKLGETVTNLADAIVGNNAQPTTLGTTNALQVGPNEAAPASPTGSTLANDITNTNTAPGGSGYSQQTSNVAVTAAVLLGPGGQAGATGAFSYSAGATALWESGSASTANDYTAVGILNNLLTVNTAAAAPPTYAVTTPASPATTIIAQTLQNNSSVADSYTIATTTFADTPTTGGSAWSVQYSTSSSCASPTSTLTTPSVAVNATYTFYTCWTPPANTSLVAVTAYGGTVKATSVNYGTVSDTTNDALFVGGYVTSQKSQVISGTVGGTACTASFVPGCTVTYSIVYTNLLPKGSGSNNASPAGAINLKIQEDGVNGVNASTGAKNNWGTWGAVSGAVTVSGGPTGTPTVTYFNAANGFTLTGAGAAQGPVTSTTVPSGCNGFRLDYPSGTFASGLPFGANNTLTVQFAVTVN